MFLCAVLAALHRSKAFRSLEDMEVHFTLEQEAQIAEVASNAGTDAERLVKEADLRLLPGNGIQAASMPPRGPLPVWHLGGAVGSLHRRDIYDDAR